MNPKKVKKMLKLGLKEIKIKGKIGKLYDLKIKKFCSSKNAIE